MSEEESGGPVPVRDLLRQMHPEPEPVEEPRLDEPEHVFETEEGAWLARAAGAGVYGTSPVGAARLLAIHFFRESDPDTPLREALVPAGRFPHLHDEELRTLLESATPIETGS